MWAIWVPTTIGHWHMEGGRPKLFASREEADDFIPKVQPQYFPAIEAKQYR